VSASFTRAASAQPASKKTARLQVALFTNSVAIGGMEKHVEMIARDLDRSEAEISTICPSWDAIEPWAEIFAANSDHHARITPDRRYGMANLARETWRLYRQLRQWRIETLHMHLTTYRGGAWTLAAARLAGVKGVLCTEHLAPDAPVPFMRRILRGLMASQFDHIICVSETNRAARERYLKTPTAKTVVVNNGIDVAPFEPISTEEATQLSASLGIPQDAKIVGTVVRLVEEKGLNYLVGAMPHVLASEPGAYLLIVGDGPLHGELEEQAIQLGIRDHVIFAGFQDDPRPYLSLMNAFVLPVPFGSASIGLLEAMAMRRAVIITFGGKGEAVEHEVTGLRLPPRDPAVLAGGILRVISDSSYERMLGENARRRIEEQFSSQGVARQLLDLYRRDAKRPAS
jgi:glycosyltransferase involved in cell wall biosynthesis